MQKSMIDAASKLKIGKAEQLKGGYVSKVYVKDSCSFCIQTKYKVREMSASGIMLRICNPCADRLIDGLLNRDN